MVTNWEDDKDTYAAFDSTDLGILLASIGYYPCGPSAQLAGENDQFRWWCDDINTLTSIESILYQGYGRTESQAKAAMLIKALQTGKVPLVWKYFNDKKQKEHRNLGQVFGDTNDPSHLDMNDLPKDAY
jgi:hypothetical protein